MYTREQVDESDGEIANGGNMEEVISMLEEQEVEDEPMCDGSDDDLGMDMYSDAEEKHVNNDHNN